MSKVRSLPALIGAYLLVSSGAICAVDSAATQAAPALHIDIPVKLDKANVVFDVGHLVLSGDMPFVLGDLHLLAGDYSNGITQGEVIAVFHGDAAYLVLNDGSYNNNRHVHAGNPYGKLIVSVVKVSETASGLN
jgi:hypothetical protein